jgi:hypothetical protein
MNKLQPLLIRYPLSYRPDPFCYQPLIHHQNPKRKSGCETHLTRQTRASSANEYITLSLSNPQAANTLERRHLAADADTRVAGTQASLPTSVQRTLTNAVIDQVGGCDPCRKASVAGQKGCSPAATRFAA